MLIRSPRDYTHQLSTERSLTHRIELFAAVWDESVSREMLIYLFACSYDIFHPCSARVIHAAVTQWFIHVFVVTDV